MTPFPTHQQHLAETNETSALNSLKVCRPETNRVRARVPRGAVSG